jgi:hypothetical protein
LFVLVTALTLLGQLVLIDKRRGNFRKEVTFRMIIVSNGAGPLFDQFHGLKNNLA